MTKERSSMAKKVAKKSKAGSRPSRQSPARSRRRRLQRASARKTKPQTKPRQSRSCCVASPVALPRRIGCGDRCRCDQRRTVASEGLERQGEVGDAVALEEAVRPGRQGARRCAHSRFHPCAVGSDLHPAARLVRRRRDQGRAPRRRRHHPRPAGRREGRGLALLHHAQPQQAFDHDRTRSIRRASACSTN